ncbi:MAG: DNA polymerase III subunit [Candidatus Cloacimonetes bacterium]|nr:DNA polymerase III subunit [Candidatus Cloacimonadota bacterium]
MFALIKGQKQAHQILTQLINEGKAAQSYLFFGPEGVGKLATALEFAKIINCQHPDKGADETCPSCHKIDSYSHPDVDLIFPTPKFEITDEGEFKKQDEQEQIQAYVEQLKLTPYERMQFGKATAIHVDKIRMIERKLRFKPNEGNYRVVIIVQAEEMTVQAANAFLKTLEEPPAYAAIILTTTNYSRLLPTIISRCQKVRFNAIPAKIIEEHLIQHYYIDPTLARISARIANGSMAKAIRLSRTDFIEARKMSLDIIDALIHDNLATVHRISQNFANNRNEELLRDILDFLAIWFEDVCSFTHGSDAISNIDHEDKLNEFFDMFQVSERVIQNIILLFEENKRMLEGHVHHELIFINTYYELRKRLHSQGIYL